jgi:hypothetical protein
MKKLACLLALLSLTSPVCAAVLNGIDDFQVNVPLFKGGFELGIAALYLQATAPELDYAVSFDSRTFEDGFLRDVQPKFKFGYNVFVGYEIPCSGNDFRLSYLNFDEKDSEHNALNAPGFIASEIDSTTLLVPAEIGTVEQGGVIVPGVVLVPGTLLPVDFKVSQASAGDTFRQSNLDLEFGQSINVDNLARVRLYAGLRKARVTHRLNATYIYNTTLTEEATVFVPELEQEITTTITLVGNQLAQIIKDSSHFDGLGPKIGMQGTFFLGGGVGMVANISTSLLVGSIDSAVSQEFAGNSNFTVTSVTADGTTLDPVTLSDLTLPVGSVLVADGSLNEVLITHPDSTIIVPNFEARIALNYTYPIKYCKAVDFELGYYINHYFNAVARPTLFDIDTRNMDADFKGPYFAINVTL